MTSTVLPTTDLYFLNSCRDWIGGWWRRGPVERLGANTFRSGDRLLLIRRDTPTLMEQAIAWSGKLIYLVDDDIDGAAQSEELPHSYRARLGEFAANHFDRLLRRADLVVCSSQVLADRLGRDPRSREIARLDPFWRLPLADQSHFDGASRIEIVHLGTASHGGALARAARPILSTLDRFPAARFTFIGVRGAHAELEAHPQARRYEPMRWMRYQRWLPRQRFHLALYPLAQTPFDRARSANKLIEHAIVGAVGVYPGDWAPAGTMGSGALLAPSDPAAWHDVLIDAIERRDEIAGTAALAAASVPAINDPVAQRRFWARVLFES
jgi:hypothetical protein